MNPFLLGLCMSGLWFVGLEKNITEHRELKNSEAWAIVAGCVGGEALKRAVLAEFARHPEWDLVHGTVHDREWVLHHMLGQGR